MAEDRALMEQLNGLLGLLEAVGINSVDKREVKRASIALKNQGSGAPIVFPPDIPESRELNDDQIQAMILKLQQAQAQAPQLMEALEDYAEERNIGGAGDRKNKRKNKPKNNKQKVANPAAMQQEAFVQAYQQQARQQIQYQHNRLHHPHSHTHGHHQHQQPQQQQPQQQMETQNDDHDDYDEDEEDDEFDEDADYPMVGPGISDDISVVSDMTTPTVVSSLHVKDEEHYSDMLPSMYMPNAGGGPPLMLQPPKRKNLVSQVGSRPGGGGPVGSSVPMRVGPSKLHAPRTSTAGGAAAKRRQNYQETMSRLHQNPYGMTMAGPQANPIILEETDEEERSVQSKNSKAAKSKPTARGGLPQRSKSGNPSSTSSSRPKPPTRTKSAESGFSGGSIRGRDPLTGASAHSGTDFSFGPGPSDDWMPFGDSSGPGTKSSKSGSNGEEGKLKKKSPKNGTRATSPPKPKKKVGSTTIDRDGFLVAPPGPVSPTKGNRAVGDGSGGKAVKKKVVKKKVVKKPPGTPTTHSSSGTGSVGEPAARPRKGTRRASTHQ